MIKEIGYCHGIENYSRHLTGRAPGAAAADAARLPAGGRAGDRRREPPDRAAGARHVPRRPRRARKCWSSTASACRRRSTTGRSASRSGKARVPQTVFVSATPGPYELREVGRRRRRADDPADRPDGPADRGAAGEGPGRRPAGRDPRRASPRSERVLVTTLTKRMAEDLTQYYHELGVRVRYLHSDIDTLERVEILRDLRRGEFDVLVGINLLREGLDLPEVSLVAILDADKEGFLRSGGSLIQTVGPRRPQRERPRDHVRRHGDRLDADGDQRDRAPARAIQAAYNEEHGITPTTIVKDIDGRAVERLRARLRRRRPRRSTASATAGRARRRTSAELERQMRAGRRQPRLRGGRGAARPASPPPRAARSGLRRPAAGDRA